MQNRLGISMYRAQSIFRAFRYTMLDLFMEFYSNFIYRVIILPYIKRILSNVLIINFVYACNVCCSRANCPYRPNLIFLNLPKMTKVPWCY